MIVPRLRSLWRLLIHGNDVDRQIAEEFQAHLDASVDRLVAHHGLSDQEARRLAQIEFGSRAKYTEESRATLGWRLLDELHVDVGYALRALRSNPGFALAATFTLALGIAANVTVFTAVNAALVRRPPFRTARPRGVTRHTRSPHCRSPRTAGLPRCVVR